MAMSSAVLVSGRKAEGEEEESSASSGETATTDTMGREQGRNRWKGEEGEPPPAVLNTAGDANNADREINPFFW
ncbi:unnamed protein product [Linum trigynum]|uniref:Uncharacterized protein n=1 Tax=Linum trigynum TaxID=586398 RepID=A0AAV2E629_9ROSI